MALVSIVSMVKNEERFIKESVLSILNQDLNLELIIVDDNSEDKTLDILKELERSFNNLKVLTNSKEGKVSAFLQGCSHIKGDYIAFFAGDDVMPVGSLKSRLNDISSLESPAVLLSKLRVLSTDKSIDGMILPKSKNKGSTSGAAIMIDRQAAKYLLDIPEELPNEDTWMELCINHLDFLNIKSHNTVACNWRVHSGNSNSIRQDYSTFNKRFGMRMQAIELFNEKYRYLLSKNKQMEIENLIMCEEYRKRGNFIGIMFLPIKLTDKIRFIFYSNKFFFSLKKLIRSI